jgi:hypothetical protein
LGTSAQGSALESPCQSRRDGDGTGYLKLKLPRFRGVFDSYVDYGAVVTMSFIASYAIGER